MSMTRKEIIEQRRAKFSNEESGHIRLSKMETLILAEIRREEIKDSDEIATGLKTADIRQRHFGGKPEAQQPEETDTTDSVYIKGRGGGYVYFLTPEGRTVANEVLKGLGENFETPTDERKDKRK